MGSIVLVAFGAIALGWACRRFGWVGPEADGPFNDYLYFVSMPALICHTLGSTGLRGVSAGLLGANALSVALLLCLLLGAWRAGLLGEHAGEMFLCSGFGNTVYLGFPLVAMRLGPEALSLAALITSVQYLVVFTGGFACVALATGRGVRGASDILWKNPILWSSVVGAALAFSGLRLPGPVEDLLALIGGGTAPLALVSLGMFLYGKRLGLRPAAVARLCAAKLLLFPLLLLLLARGLGLSGLPAEVSLLESLMPLAVTNFVLARRLGLDEELVAEAVLASTVAAAPLLLAFDSLRTFLP